MAERTARVRLVAETTQFRRSINDAATAVDGLVKKSGGLEQLGGKMQAAGGKMTRGLTLPLAAAMGVAAKSASDLQQAVGGTEAVFGDASDAIDAYAKTAARASGLSEREFREATTAIGGQLKRMTGDVDLAAEQSMELTKVAADLAATYGGTTAEAVAALGSAFRGEADPAERFNLNLKIGAVNAKAVEMGLAATTKEVDDSARAQATLALIMEQSADATGQFARESGSAAGSMQIAKAEMENASAEIGAALLPALSKVAGGVADIATAFGNLPGPIQNGVMALAGLMAVSGPILSMGGRLVSGWSKVGPAFDKVATGAYGAAGGIGKFGAVAGALALTAVVFQLSSMAKELTTVNTEVERLNGLADDELAETLERMLTRAFTGHAGNPAEAAADFASEIERIARESPAAAEALLRIAQSADGDLAGAMERAGVTTDMMSEAMERGVGAAARSGEAQERNAEILEDTVGANEEAADAVDAHAEAQKELEDRIKGVTDAMRAHLDPLFAAQDAMLGHKDAQDKVKSSELQLLKAQNDLNAAIAKHGPNSDEAAEATLGLLRAENDLTSANRDVVRSALDVASASAKLKARVDDGSVSIEDAEDQLRLWVEQGIITAGQAYTTAEELRGTAGAADAIAGRNIEMAIGLSGYEQTIARLDELARRAGAPLVFNASIRGREAAADRKVGGPVAGASGQMVPINAHGGEYVLSADIVDAIKNGRPSAGLPALASVGASAAPGPTVNNYNLEVPAEAARRMNEQRLVAEMRSLQYLSGAR